MSDSENEKKESDSNADSISRSMRSDVTLSKLPEADDATP